jgi:hypothetical protein
VPTYEAWNKALIDYTITGLPRGSRIYLAIDDEAIAWVARELDTSPIDFSEVIRLRCLNNEVIELDRIYADTPKDYSTPPRYFAFLCAMVLAAHKMGENEETNSPLDYFTHFNGILGLSFGGRPPGLEGEQRLWDDWAFWLLYNGFQPTATKTGTQLYTFARSQALLRGLDKDRLWRHFGSNIGKYMGRLGKGELTAQLRADAKLTTSSFPKHLRELLDSEGKLGSTRYDDLSDALYETFDAWVENGRPHERFKTYQTIAPSTIRAGLYRTEDYLSGEIVYYLLPRQPRHIQTSEAVVTYQDVEYPLISSRAGWFEPLPFPFPLTALENTVTLPLQGIEHITSLVVNTVDFWILPSDPDDRTSGVYASWIDRPELGESFVLLCRPELKSDIEILRNEQLINWSHEVEIGGWVEYSGMMVLGEVWSDVRVEHKELVNQLRPRAYMGIALQGGLRDIKSGAWLVGYGPKLGTYGFANEFSLVVIDLNGNSEDVTFDSLKSGDTISVEWSRPGDFVLRMQSEGEHYERYVRIIDWGDIRLSPVEESVGIKIGNGLIFGAFIETSE